ncbi:MAG: hypothetical protein HC837_03075 [Chloroflexaceae bacterium]|nr:hypothetical protein [Chloroflexaceae bacterium]
MATNDSGQSGQPPDWSSSSASNIDPLIDPIADAQPGNQADRWALIALTVALTILLSTCVPGFSCLAPLIAGIVALAQARKAVEPQRARTYGWIATGVGILMVLALVLFIVAYGSLLFIMLDLLQEGVPEPR